MFSRVILSMLVNNPHYTVTRIMKAPLKTPKISNTPC